MQLHSLFPPFKLLLTIASHTSRLSHYLLPVCFLVPWAWSCALSLLLPSIPDMPLQYSVNSFPRCSPSIWETRLYISSPIFQCLAQNLGRRCWLLLWMMDMHLGIGWMPCFSILHTEGKESYYKEKVRMWHTEVFIGEVTWALGVVGMGMVHRASVGRAVSFPHSRPQKTYSNCPAGKIGVWIFPSSHLTPDLQSSLGCVASNILDLLKNGCIPLFVFPFSDCICVSPKYSIF